MVRTEVLLATGDTNPSTKCKAEEVYGNNGVRWWVFVFGIPLFICLLSAASYYSIWLVKNDLEWLAATIAIGTIFVAPLLSSSPWRNRAGFIVTVPFSVAGGGFGFHIYSFLLRFSWFGWVFNNIDMGLVGMGLFVIAFATIFGLPIYLLVQKVLATKDGSANHEVK